MSAATDINVMAWCAPGHMRRLTLEQPFPWEGWSVASNGHVILLIADGGEIGRDAQVNNPTEPPPSHLIERIVTSVDWDGPRQPIPAVATHAPPALTCGACTGSGTVYMCGECNGTGERECCECGQDCDCKACYGTGRQKAPSQDTRACDDCDGKGTLAPKTVYAEVLPGVCVDQQYLALAAALPDVEIIAAHSPNFPIGLVWSGGRALIAPARPDILDVAIRLPSTAKHEAAA